jgi:hypothetical protein
METFEHFEEQERSWAHLDELGQKLAKDAAEVLAEDPRASIAGLILESRTPEAEGLWALVEQAMGEAILGPRCAGLIPKALAVEILKLNAGCDAIAWLEQNAVPGQLPVLVSMEHGFRMGVVAIPRIWD